MVIMRKVIAVSTAGLVAICSTMGFEPPGPQQRLQAIGPTNGLPEVLQLAFTPDDDFTPVPAPGPDDWLTAHGESGQTFEQFRNSRPNRPDAQRRVLYLQPLGAFPEGQSLPSKSSVTIQQPFFNGSQAPGTLAPISIKGSRFTNRTNSITGRRQWLTQDALYWLKGQLPADAFCLLAITMEDLYLEPSWNFVLARRH